MYNSKDDFREVDNMLFEYFSNNKNDFPKSTNNVIKSVFEEKKILYNGKKIYKLKEVIRLNKKNKLNNMRKIKKFKKI